MSKVTRAAVRGALAVGLLAGVSAAGAASASAAVTPMAVTDTYACTATYPEVCLGIYHNGSSISHEQLQGNLNHDVGYEFELVLPDHDLYTTLGKTTSAAGWTAPVTAPFTSPGQYCAYINYLPPGASKAQTSAEACVDVS
jgi:hypothetical protein